jgi:hypothetical protein
VAHKAREQTARKIAVSSVAVLIAQVADVLDPPCALSTPRVGRVGHEKQNIASCSNLTTRISAGDPLETAGLNPLHSASARSIKTAPSFAIILTTTAMD